MRFVAQKRVKRGVLGRVLQEEADSKAQAFPSPHLGGCRLETADQVLVTDQMTSLRSCSRFRKFPICSIIRSTEAEGALGALNALTADGLFIGQSPEFFAVLKGLARAADAAPRGHEDDDDADAADTVMAMVIGMVTGGAMTRQQPIVVEPTTF